MRAPTLALVLASLLLWPQIPEAGPGTSVPRKVAGARKKTRGGAAKRSSLIRGFANRWMGTPYLWGGTQRSGVDCSGYAREMFRELFNVELPRTTKGQIEVGMSVPIQPGKLGAGFEPGDLFFYVDRVGIPNHVVIYMGDGRFTHSASGRGVVQEGYKALWGRRVVGRRVLVPSKKRGGGYGPIPAAGPMLAADVPCPPSVRAQPEDLRRLRSTPISREDFKEMADRQICEWRDLAERLGRLPAPEAKQNAARIEVHVEWLQSIEALKGSF